MSPQKKPASIDAMVLPFGSRCLLVTTAMLILAAASSNPSVLPSNDVIKISRTQECDSVLDSFSTALWSSPYLTDECRTHAALTDSAPNPSNVDRESGLRYLLQCEREEKLKKLARKLCKRTRDHAAAGGQWDLEQVYRVYGDYRKNVHWETSGPVLQPKTFSKLQECCSSSGKNDRALVDCLRAARPRDFTKVYVTDPNLTKSVVAYIKDQGDSVNSVLEMGSGKGNWLWSLGRAGVETVVGIEPAYMGSLALYEDSWDVKYGPVQLDSMLGDGGDGDLQIRAFMCERFGATDHQFDLMWSMEVFEHIPKKLHAGMLRWLAAATLKWVFTSIAPPNQHGLGHISSMSKAEWHKQWELLGFREADDESIRGVLKSAKWLQIRRNAMLMKRVQSVSEVEKQLDRIATSTLTTSPSAAPSNLSLSEANYVAPGADGHAALSCTAPWGPDADASGPSIALFTYIFFDYRKEFTRFVNFRGILSTSYGWHRDRYMFIDAATFSKHSEKVALLRSDGWIMCAVPANYIPEVAFPRTTMGRKVSAGWDLTKYFKFGHVPAVLARYDYVYHLDASIFQNAKATTKNYNLHKKKELMAFLAHRSDVGLVLTRHIDRSCISQEWAFTVKLRMEMNTHINNFKCAMTRLFGQQGVAAAPLFALGMWVRTLRDARINAAFRETFRALKVFGLKRDQNVFGFALWDTLGADYAMRVAVCSRNFLRCEGAKFPQNVSGGGHLDRTTC